MTPWTRRWRSPRWERQRRRASLRSSPRHRRRPPPRGPRPPPPAPSIRTAGRSVAPRAGAAQESRRPAHRSASRRYIARHGATAPRAGQSRCRPPRSPPAGRERLGGLPSAGRASARASPRPRAVPLRGGPRAGGAALWLRPGAWRGGRQRRPRSAPTSLGGPATPSRVTFAGYTTPNVTSTRVRGHASDVGAPPPAPSPPYPAPLPFAGATRGAATVNDDEPPGGRLVDEEPAATYSPRPVKAKYHRRCGA